MEESLHLKLTVRLFADDDQRCFGPGIATLLQRVQENHSLRSAAASMGMAYSKAWRIIHTAEEALQLKLLDSTIGGQHGGGAALTPEAEQLLDAYLLYCADLNNYAQEHFSTAFSAFQKNKNRK